ncbi:hypothetical protein GCM10020256_18040 [Streptomyces thermocoprophilus]
MTPVPPARRAPSRRARTVRRAAAALVASAVSVCLVAASAPPAPLGVGDRLFPYLGNPGYDVASYDLSFTYSGKNTEPLKAVTTIDAWTTRPLERINLDFAYGDVESVEVDGEAASFATAGEDLVITPARPLTAGAWTRVTVRHTSDPTPGTDRDGGWVRTDDGLAMANQADAAHLVFPCNDHPSDKAMFTIRVTAPRRLHGRRQRTAGRGGAGGPHHHMDVPHPAPHGHRTRPGLHRPLPRPAPHRPARAAPAGRRARRRRGEAGTLAEEDPRPDRLDGEQGRPLPLRDVRPAHGRRRHRLRTGDADAVPVREGSVHRTRVPRVVRRLDHGP